MSTGQRVWWRNSCDFCKNISALGASKNSFSPQPKPLFVGEFVLHPCSVWVGFPCGSGDAEHWGWGLHNFPHRYSALPGFSLPITSVQSFFGMQFHVQIPPHLVLVLMLREAGSILSAQLFPSFWWAVLRPNGVNLALLLPQLYQFWSRVPIQGDSAA